ncbi:indole-3-glycerol phosphate synthase TrpC [Jiulongibacter sediminis]|jgi:indole-3-glycerol phosphate synthase|uniref:indole-3-glycerol phosphate synthase TrpC n=1 Tax=Jiulongibacter sediminis TaxID=1605367 RepID=UPI0026EE0C84|nr:indole-3-glycerol phosphate synthase TrpC [Jiulongibacter sediminis]
MTILEKINQHKREEVFTSKSITSVDELRSSKYFDRKCNSLKASLMAEGSSGIIAEFKRKSPSKGEINPNVDVEEVTAGYALSGAAGVSVLTDKAFFGGSKNDLIKARGKNPDLPLLRKDFMIDPYQVCEAKAWGADVILLIAASLTPEKINELGAKAHELGMEVLLEVHNEEELTSSPMDYVDIVGVNNRNLKNFNESNFKASLDLSSLIPADKVKISESCINDPSVIKDLRKSGYQGFLIGESFMKTKDPAAALSTYIIESKG